MRRVLEIDRIFLTDVSVARVLCTCQSAVYICVLIGVLINDNVRGAFGDHLNVRSVRGSCSDTMFSSVLICAVRRERANVRGAF